MRFSHAIKQKCYANLKKFCVQLYRVYCLLPFIMPWSVYVLNKFFARMMTMTMTMIMDKNAEGTHIQHIHYNQFACAHLPSSSANKWMYALGEFKHFTFQLSHRSSEWQCQPCKVHRFIFVKETHTHTHTYLQ